MTLTVPPIHGFPSPHPSFGVSHVSGSPHPLGHALASKASLASCSSNDSLVGLWEAGVSSKSLTSFDSPARSSLIGLQSMNDGMNEAIHHEERLPKLEDSARCFVVMSKFSCRGAARLLFRATSWLGEKLKLYGSIEWRLPFIRVKHYRDMQLTDPNNRYSETTMVDVKLPFAPLTFETGEDHYQGKPERYHVVSADLPDDIDTTCRFPGGRLSSPTSFSFEGKHGISGTPIHVEASVEQRCDSSESQMSLGGGVTTPGFDDGFGLGLSAGLKC